MLNKLDSHEQNILKQAKRYGILDHDIHCYSEIFELEKLIEDWENQLQLATEHNIDWNPADYDPQGLDIEIENIIDKNNSFARECKNYLDWCYYNNLGVN